MIFLGIFRSKPWRDESPFKCPLTRADKVPRTAAGYRVTDGNIAAIDFGTTSVSLAFTTKGDYKVNTLVLDCEAQFTRTFNVILLKKEGAGIKVEAFGANAKKKFGQLRFSDHSNYIYFERIKMLMRREKVILKLHICMHDHDAFPLDS